MYLKQPERYYRGTAQGARGAPFLLLLQRRDQPIGQNNLFAVVRKVALLQCGHFMMGKANLSGQWVSVSGNFGNDGLPMDVDALPSDAVPVPTDVYNIWNAHEYGKRLKEWGNSIRGKKS